jgi:hypothetical protein
MELDYFSKRELIGHGIDGLTNSLVAELEGSTPLILKSATGHNSGKLPSTLYHLYIILQTTSWSSK